MVRSNVVLNVLLGSPDDVVAFVGSQRREVDQLSGVAQHDPGQRADLAGLIRQDDLFRPTRRPGRSPTFLTRPLLGEVVAPEDDILARIDDGSAVGGAEDVLGGQHQHAGLDLGLGAQRDVHGHLIAVEVGVERRAHQRMNLDGLALDQHRLERLDPEAVQRRGAVQQDRVLLDHLSR